MNIRRNPSIQARHFVTGFSAIELMVVVSIISILAALAAPSFTPLIENWRVREASEQLQSTLYYARSEAIKRGGQVVIQKIPNNTNGCTSATDNSDWDCGWIVCQDTNGNGACNATEPVLQRIDAPPECRSPAPAAERASSSTAGAWSMAPGWASAWCL